MKKIYLEIQRLKKCKDEISMSKLCGMLQVCQAIDSSYSVDQVIFTENEDRRLWGKIRRFL